MITYDAAFVEWIKMILSAKIVKNPEAIKNCDECGWPIFKHMLKLYGMAHQEDKPFNIYLHPDCAEKSIDMSQEPKIEATLDLLLPQQTKGQEL